MYNDISSRYHCRAKQRNDKCITNKQCTMTSFQDIIVVLNALYNKRNTDIKSNKFDFISVLLLLCIAY